MTRGLKNLCAMLVAGVATLAAPAMAADYPGTTDDYVQLQQLMARYNYALDNWDGKAYAAVFTTDGIFHQGSRGCIVGADQLNTLVAKTAPAYASLPPQQHMTTLGPVVFIDKDHAYAHSTLLVVGSAGFIKPFQAGTGMSYTGAYDDTFRRVNGHWLIADRNENTKTANYVPPIPCPPPAAAAAPKN